MKTKTYEIVSTYKNDLSHLDATFDNYDEVLKFYNRVCYNERFESKKAEYIELIEYTYDIEDEFCDLVEDKVLHIYYKK